MSNPAEPSPTSPSPDEAIVAGPDAHEYLEGDSPEVRSLDPGLDLDVFDAEVGRREAPAPVGMSAPPEEMSGPVQPSLDEPLPTLRPWEMATAYVVNQRRPIAGLLSLVAIGGVFWTVTALQGRQAPPQPTAPVAAQAVAQPAAAASEHAVAAPALASSLVSAPAAPQTPAPLRAVAPVSAAVPAPALAPPPDAPGLVAAGWLKVDAPIDLDISSEGRVIGTSRSDRTMLASGRYDLLLANERVGYTERQTVTILPGQLRTLRIQIPAGQVSVNARPWANVTVDGMAVGETPLGNLPMSAGVHQVVFTHPELGQRRVEAIVQAGQHLRLNVDMRAP
ncbi:MAG: PEGA domain-containing protein [Vicinamibacterales bacterium]